MTAKEGKEVSLSRWNAAGIREALDRGLENLSPLDPYQDIDLLLTSVEEECDIGKFLDTSEEDRQVLGFGDHVVESDDEGDDIFEPERNFSDVFNSFAEE